MKYRVNLVKTVDDSYDIEIGRKLKDVLVDDIKGGLFGRIKKFAVITDDNVLPLYAQAITDTLIKENYTANLIVFPAGEKSKTRATKEYIEDQMLSFGYRRDCAVIAVGGGVVSDVAGFVAGTFARGVPFVNYATSLLAAADASIGGKTAVDTPLATNLIGLFNQPKKVYIDIDCWNTLPKREVYCGLAETVKHACLADEELFGYLEEHMEDILGIEETSCEHIAKANCNIKYRVVMQDERESGLREVLNLGHTVGRAIETASDYRLLHGEAVSIGLVAQALLSKKMGYMDASQVDRLIKLLDSAHLPVAVPDYIDREKLVTKLYTDKKVRDGRLRFVVQKGIGAVVCFGENEYATPVSEKTIREIIMEM